MNYLLRDIDPDLWRRVKARLARENSENGTDVSLRDLLLRLLRAYLSGR